MSNITFVEEVPANQLVRKDLQPGTIFTYHPAKQLFVVPQPAFGRHPNIAEKDIVLGGTHSGSLDDWHPNLPVVVCDLTVTRSAVQPAPEAA